MRRILSLLVCLCFTILSSSAAKGNVYITPERRFLTIIARCAEEFSAGHDERLPTKWADLEPFLLGESLQHHPDLLGLSKRYGFLPRPLLWDEAKGRESGLREVYLITRRPFRDSQFEDTWYGGNVRTLRPPGRYLLFRRPDRTFSSAYLLEKEVQLLFRGAEELLPAPDQEPKRLHEQNYLRERSLSIALSVFLAAIFVSFVAAIGCLIYKFQLWLVRLLRRWLCVPARTQPRDPY